MADIANAAHKFTERTAIVTGQEKYSYCELFHLVNHIYHLLKTREETIVGIAAENKVETYASILAALYAGKTYVMLCHVTPRLS